MSFVPYPVSDFFTGFCLEYDFLAYLLLCLDSYFSFFFSFLSYFYLLRVPSSVQQPPATLSKYVFYFIIRVISACVICTLPRLGILLFLFVEYCFRSSCLSGGVFCCCALVPGTLALDLPTLIL